MNDLYSNLDRSLYKETLAEDGSDTSFNDPTLFSSDNVVEYGQFRKISINGIVLSVPKGESIQKSINKISELGGGEVRLAVGTHIVNEDIVVPSNTSLVGNGPSTVIDFNNGAFGIRLVGSDVYSTGTVAVNNDSTSVTGTGTTWTTAMEGQSILIGEFWYIIDTVNSTTSITLATPFLAANVSGVSYIIATTVDSVILKNFIVQNSSTSLVKAQYINGGTFDNVIAINGAVGFDGDDSSFINLQTISAIDCTEGMNFNNFKYGTFFNGNASNCTNNGITFNNVSNWGSEIFSVINCGAIGISITNSSNCGFEDFTVAGSGTKGIEFVSGNSQITLSDGSVSSSGSDGVKLTATTDAAQINNVNITNNGGYGVNIANANCDNNIVSNNYFSTNTSGDINDSGTGTIKTGNSPNSLNTTTPPGAANTALSNLSSVAVNTSLLLGTNDGGALGSITKQWSDLFLAEGGVINWDNGDVTVTQNGNLLTVAGGALTVNGALSANDGVVTFTDTTSLGVPLLKATTTFTGDVVAEFENLASNGNYSYVNLYHNSSSPAANDGLGAIDFYGNNSTPAKFRFAEIVVDSTVVTAGSEAARMSFYLANGSGVLTQEVLLTTSALSPGVSDGTALGTGSLMWSDLFLASGGVVNFNNGNATLTHSAGLLTSNVDVVVPAEAYSSSWNGSNEVPTKNDVYDKIETLGSATTALTILPQPVNPVDPAASAPFATLGITDNTTMHVYQMIVPFKITANKFSIRTVAVATPGTLDVTLYAEDGQSQIFSSTTASLSSANSVDTESLSSVVIPAGIYYLGVNGNGVLNVQVWSWDTDSGFNGAATLVAGVSSEPVLEGTLTISTGAPPSTITPSSITGARLHAPIIRFDN